MTEEKSRQFQQKNLTVGTIKGLTEFDFLEEQLTELNP